MVRLQCPNIAYHLVGMKKVQQALTARGAVERFLSPEDSALIRSSFAGLWNLDVAEADDGGASVVRGSGVGGIAAVRLLVVVICGSVQCNMVLSCGCIAMHSVRLLKRHVQSQPSMC